MLAVSSLISRTTRLVIVDHGMFGFFDEGGRYPEVKTSDITWFAATNGEVLISAAQELVKPAMQFEHWDGEPDPPDAAAEREATFPFQVTHGTIGLNFIAAGSEPEVFRLPPGQYTVHLAAYHLTEVMQEVEGMYRQYDDYDNPNFTLRRDGLLGKELYIAQFWSRSA
ncbi:hypothetical protein [Actinomadura chibensis]|uniref:Uncharacterized protein n=1 Tax=Actinomadura chibensis TaxID=392828 RepID=A0A5D0N8Z5_9ACTN|nr:hypothetical protein [Actinomadura chibensis]TYB40819.1 hypothetical protein FXF69_38025 [Actinomadura chibensis]